MATGMKWQGLAEYQRYMRGLPPKVRREVVRRNLQSGRLIQGRARRSISRRLSDDNRRRRDGSTRLGSFTGRLAGAITFEAKRRGRVFVVEVGPEDKAIWGWIHEVGKGKYPTRPWFGPVVDQLRGRVFRLWERVLRVL